MPFEEKDQIGEADLDSYVVIETPSPATRHNKIVIGSPSPRVLRARRIRAFTSVAERDALVNSIDLGKISQRLTEDFRSGSR